MSRIAVILLSTLVLAGCGSDAGDGERPMSSSQMSAQQQQAQANLPPEAKAAIAKTGRYGGADSEYAKSMAQAQGKR